MVAGLQESEPRNGGVMKKLMLSLTAIALFGAGVLNATDAHAQSCLKVGAVAGDQVRLEIDSFSGFWFQHMELTVRNFAEFAELQTNPGGSFCGLARVHISGNLVWGGGDGKETLLLADTFLKAGTRLQLSQFVPTGSNVPPFCSNAGPSDTCYENGTLYRSATVLNR